MISLKLITFGTVSTFILCFAHKQVKAQILKTKPPSINLALSSTVVTIIFLSFYRMVWLRKLHINQHKGHLLHHLTSDAGLVIHT